MSSLQALAGYRTICGAHTTPTLIVHDQGNYTNATLRALAHERVQAIGMHPTGRGPAELMGQTDVLPHENGRVPGDTLRLEPPHVQHSPNSPRLTPDQQLSTPADWTVR
jgi:hypothetical protein